MGAGWGFLRYIYVMINKEIVWTEKKQEWNPVEGGPLLFSWIGTKPNVY